MQKQGMQRAEMADALGWDLKDFRKFIDTHRLHRKHLGLSRMPAYKRATHTLPPFSMKGFPKVEHRTEEDRAYHMQNVRYEDDPRAVRGEPRMSSAVETWVSREASC